MEDASSSSFSNSFEGGYFRLWENLGWGSFIFVFYTFIAFLWANFFEIFWRRVLQVVIKSRWGVAYFCVLLHFYEIIFWNLLTGYIKCPPLTSPLPPRCICASEYKENGRTDVFSCFFCIRKKTFSTLWIKSNFPYDFRQKKSLFRN